MATIQDGDWVVCYLVGERPYMTHIDSKRYLDTHKGKLELRDVVGKNYGSYVQTNTGAPIVLMRPTTEDFVMSVRRKSNISYPKDISRIIFRLGITSGCRVVEFGAGSGAMTISLAMAVRPTGKVYSYDVRQDHLDQARKNVERLGLGEHVEFNMRWPHEPIEQTDVYALLMDIPEPWTELEVARKALAPGGYISCTVPSYNQLEEFNSALWPAGFMALESLEVLNRNIVARDGRTRPDHRMTGHTQFIHFASMLDKSTETGDSDEPGSKV